MLRNLNMDGHAQTLKVSVEKLLYDNAALARLEFRGCTEYFASHLPEFHRPCLV